MSKTAVTRKILAVILLVAAIGMGFWWWRSHQSTDDNGSSTGGSSRSNGTSGSQSSSFNKKKYSTTDPTSLWVVVNKPHALSPLGYTPNDLTSVGSGQLMRAKAATALKNLFADAGAAGYALVAQSGYRSYDTQVAVYNNEVKAFGQVKADSESARPGHSEHQTGWAVDIGSAGCYEDCFGTTNASKWLLANAYKYGFILRYPSNKSSVTGYRNEPWHFRYVGTDLSKEMKSKGITTLEEFFGISGGTSY